MEEVPPATRRPELVLSGPITLETLGSIKLVLLQYLVETSGPCLIQAVGVTDLDSAGAQLLYAFVTALARRAATVCWVTVSPSLLVSARAFGMDACLGLPAAPPSKRR
jgi:anti-anti-sigma regulatory factor